MKAHFLNGDETVLVTGTLDPAEALAFLDSESRKIPNGEGREGDIADMYLRARDATGHPERGNVVPQHPEAEYTWVWMAAPNGRCKGVTFE